jgi:hypothetical protein
MTTANMVDLGLSGSTGTVHFAGATSPTFITPVLGVATATSLAFSPTTDGVVGTAAADAAGSGYVGEYISSHITYASRVTLTSGSNVDITSITLSAGDWDVTANAYVTATVHLNNVLYWINTSSVTQPDASLISSFTVGTDNFGATCGPVPLLRLTVSGTTHVYLSAYQTCSGTPSGCGILQARRVR